MYHRDDDITCRRIIKRLSSYGVAVTLEDGQLTYYGNSKVALECSQLYLVRHAETVGTRMHRFMGSQSYNSHLTEKGISSLAQTARQIESMGFNSIFYSDIPRVEETARALYSYMKNATPFRKISCMVGIDNTGWEDKRKEELTGIDAADFYQREVRHNIFAKSSGGSSWGQVLLGCASLIEYLNSHCSGEKVLLISQKSVQMGIKILLQLEYDPWRQYDSETFYGLKEKGQNDYGCLQAVYIREDNGREREVAEG